MLYDLDCVTYQDRATGLNVEGVVRVNGPVVILRPDGSIIKACRVVLLRVVRGDTVVAEVQGLASRNQAHPRLRRLRTEFGTRVEG
jgi:hypothetical protein